jgi:hypothetical protein
MRTSSISLLTALAGVVALVFYLAAVPQQQKAPAAAPFCKTTEEHERLHGHHRGGKHAHRAHQEHHQGAHGHAGAHQQHQHHVAPTVNVPPARVVSVQPISPVATLKVDAFDAPSPLSIAEAEKASRATHR